MAATPHNVEKPENLPQSWPSLYDVSKVEKISNGGRAEVTMDVDVEEAIRRARKRSSFWRALAHPLGYRDGL